MDVSPCYSQTVFLRTHKALSYINILRGMLIYYYVMHSSSASFIRPRSSLSIPIPTDAHKAMFYQKYFSTIQMGSIVAFSYASNYFLSYFRDFLARNRLQQWCFPATLEDRDTGKFRQDAPSCVRPTRKLFIKPVSLIRC